MVKRAVVNVAASTNIAAADTNISAHVSGLPATAERAGILPSPSGPLRSISDSGKVKFGAAFRPITKK